MRGQLDKIDATLLEPDVVVQSQSDASIRLFHRFYRLLSIGDKFVCVVVKYQEDRAFVVTAYFTDRVKRGEVLWTR